MGMYLCGYLIEGGFRKICCSKYFVLILSFLQYCILNVVGELPVSLVAILLLLPFIASRLVAKYFIDKVYKGILLSLAIIELVQITWFFFSDVPFPLQVRGISLTIVGVLNFCFYLYVFEYNILNVFYYILGRLVASFFWVNVMAEIDGTDFGMWKFQIYPRIVVISILIVLLYAKRFNVRILLLFLCIVGGLGIVTGARSSGGTLLFASFISLCFMQKFKSVYFLLALLTMYFAYCFFYVPKVLNGEIDSGNSSQLVKVENPYNPLLLLQMGRTDAFVPFVAFFDNPLGWGWYANDPNLKYTKMVIDIKGEDFNINRVRRNTIPMHSVIGYYSCSYGVIVFLCFIYIIYICYRCLNVLVQIRNEYLFVAVYYFISLVWTMFFSPPAHMKNITINIAIIIAIYNRVKMNYLWKKF